MKFNDCRAIVVSKLNIRGKLNNRVAGGRFQAKTAESSGAAARQDKITPVLRISMRMPLPSHSFNDTNTS